MSYEKIKSIKIDEKEGKVFINCASNNVRPITYYREEYPHFSRILQENGREAVEIEILKTYEGGSFQQGKNKYTKALKVLFHIFGEEYKKFDWRIDKFKWGTPEHEEEDKNKKMLRESEEFDDLLKKCLNYKLPKEKWVITKNILGNWNGKSEKAFGKSCLTCMKWNRSKEKATKFDFEEDARLHIFEKFKDEWEVERY